MSEPFLLFFKLLYPTGSSGFRGNGAEPWREPKPAAVLTVLEPRAGFLHGAARLALPALALPSPQNPGRSFPLGRRGQTGRMELGSCAPRGTASARMSVCVAQVWDSCCRITIF